jgi:chloramphenicol-sensitive protein RarD
MMDDEELAADGREGDAGGTGAGGGPEARVPRADARRTAAGVLHGIAAYLSWGIVTPLYFRWLREVSPWELLAWRVLAGLPLLLGILAWRRDLASIGRALRDPGTRARILLSTALITTNWYVFIVSVVTGRLTESSLGYYINPLMSVALGVLVLGERLRRLQGVAVAIATAGVATLTVAQGRLPWISIVLAATFALYGLLRKRMAAGPTTGLAVEMLALLPAMLLLQLELGRRGIAQCGGEVWTTFGLVAGGAVTTIPLVFFAVAARRLRLATIGLLQYIAPTAQLALAVLLFGEPFGAMRGVAFALIWVAVGLYTAVAWRGRERVG